MQRMRREGVEGAPGLVPWRGKGRSGTGVFAWCLSEFVEIEYRQPNSFASRRGDQDRTSQTVFIKCGNTYTGRRPLPEFKLITAVPGNNCLHCQKLLDFGVRRTV